MRITRILCCLMLTAGLIARAEPPAGATDEAADRQCGEGRGVRGRGSDALRDPARGRRKQALKLLPKPVLRWSNPLRGEIHGSVVLWTDNGCPEAVASIYQFFHRKQLNVELVSLSEAPAERRTQGQAPVDSRGGSQVRFTSRRARAGRHGGGEAIPDARAGPQVHGFTRGTRGAGRQADGTPAHGQAPAHLRGDGWLRPRGGGVRVRDHDRPRDPPARRIAKGDDRPRMGVGRRPDALPSGATEAGREGGVGIAGGRAPWDKIRGPEGQYIILEWTTPEAAAKN